MLMLNDGGAFDWWFRAGMEYPAVFLFFAFWIFAFGACLGSFLNVCIWRMPHGESVVSAPSHCTKCGAEIRWYDNLPVISYLVLRGRCRSCRQPYSPRYLIVEVLTGILFVALFVKAGLARQPIPVLAVYFPMAMLIVTTCWIDAEHRLIPDLTTYPALALGLIFSAAFPSIRGVESHLASLGCAAASAAIVAFALGLFELAGRRIAGCPVLGWGDVKFAAATAALIGLPGAIFSVGAGALVGTFYGIGLALSTGRRLRRLTIPFGPFLAGATLVWMFAGEWILRWYLQFCRLAQ